MLLGLRTANYLARALQRAEQWCAEVLGQLPYIHEPNPHFGPAAVR